MTIAPKLNEMPYLIIEKYMAPKVLFTSHSKKLTLFYQGSP
jgi:hypothetical protein